MLVCQRCATSLLPGAALCSACGLVIGETTTTAQPIAAVTPLPEPLAASLPPVSPRDYGSLAPVAQSPMFLSADQTSAWSTPRAPGARGASRSTGQPQGLPTRYLAIGLLAVALLIAVAVLVLH